MTILHATEASHKGSDEQDRGAWHSKLPRREAHGTGKGAGDTNEPDPTIF